MAYNVAFVFSSMGPGVLKLQSLPPQYRSWDLKALPPKRLAQWARDTHLLPS